MGFRRFFETTDVSQKERDRPTDEICEGSEVGQLFACNVDGLRRIQFLFEPFRRINHHEIAYTLRLQGPNGRVVREAVQDASLIDRHHWFSFEFEPVEESAGQSFYIGVTSRGSEPGNAVGLWYRSHNNGLEGILYLDGKPRDGYLAMETFGISSRALYDNARRFQESFELGMHEVSNQPLMIFNEMTTTCNIKCIHCRPKGEDPGIGWRERDFGNIEKSTLDVLEPVIPDATVFSLSGWGESLLNPNFLGFVERVRGLNPDACITFTTNGTLLTEEVSKLVIDNQVSDICISIDSVHKEKFEKIRAGASYDLVLKNIRRLVAMKRERGATFPILRSEMVAMQENIEELPDHIDFIAELGLEKMCLEILLGPFPEMTITDFEPHLHLYEDAKERAEKHGIVIFGTVADIFEDLLEKKRLARDAAEVTIRNEAQPETPDSDDPYAGMSVWQRRLKKMTRHPIKAPMGYLRKRVGTHDTNDSPSRYESSDLRRPACPEPWQSVFIDWHGNVRTCCVNNTVFGNIRHQPIEVVWNGREFRRFRKDFVEGNYDAQCRTCLASGRKLPMIAPFTDGLRPAPLAGATEKPEEE